SPDARLDNRPAVATPSNGQQSGTRGGHCTRRLKSGMPGGSRAIVVALEFVGATLLATLAGCGRPTPPGTFVGESAHFRLFVDPALFVPPDFDGLAALE